MKKIMLLITLCTLLFAVGVQAQTYTNIFTEADTSASVADTVNFGFIAAEITVFNDATANDTLFISTKSNFADGYTFKRVGGTNTIASILYTAISTQVIYLKYGSTATSGKKYRVEAVSEPGIFKY